MANPSLQALSWRCKKLTKQDLVIAAVGLALIILSFSFLFKSSFPKITSSTLFPLTSDYVELTLLRNAKERGAFCLDGSLPGYHFDKGFGSGSNNWLLHLEGGGWCDSIASCTFRKAWPVGSSDRMDRQIRFLGLLSRYPAQNPDFFNWNRVKIRYCDGASFAGHPESEFQNGTNLFFRGQLIWDALMDELLEMGMSNAKQALLSGCSAGGLAMMIHCDDFQRKLPKAAVVKCLGDASVFLDEKDLTGRHTMQLIFQNVVKLHGVAKSLPSDCLAKMDPYKCFFPQQLLKSIKTPIFLVQPAYDHWQIQHVLAPSTANIPHAWRRCRLGLTSCSASQMKILHGFRNSMLNALDDFEKNEDRGMFINSCFIHCQTWQDTWHGPNSPRIDNKTIAESVGDWYFGRERVKRIDCQFPCNPSCTNKDFLEH